MRMSKGKKVALVGFIYLAALGVAQADTNVQCVDKAKEAARKMYGNCLADFKTIELQDLRKAYQSELQMLRKKHDQEVAALKAERAELRKGIMKAKKNEIQDNLQVTQDTNLSLAADSSQVKDEAQDITTPQITLKSVKGAKVEISPLQDGNSVELPEPQSIE